METLQNAAQHTPGPWVARQEFANRWRIEQQVGKEQVPLSVGLACTTVLEVGTNDKDTAANARLIAAAPDLLAALVALEEAARQAMTGEIELSCLAVERYKAREVIAKAV